MIIIIIIIIVIVIIIIICNMVDKGIDTFPKGISPKVNVIARLVYELA